MTQTIRERRALSQRSIRSGDLYREAHQANLESMASMRMLGGALLALAFVGLCACTAVVVIDYLTDGKAFGADVPPAIERVAA